MTNNNPSLQQSESPKTTLQDIWLVIMKRKWTFAVVVLVVLATVGLASFLIKPTYTARGTLLIEKEPNILSFEDVFQIETFNSDYYQTQYRLLQSRSLAAETIQRIKLYEDARFVKEPANAESFDKVGPVLRERLIDRFLRRESVEPIRETRLVEVRFKDHDPKFAAEILNSLFDSFIEMNIQKRSMATEQATEFLTTQIATVKADIQENEKKLQEYGAEKNIIALSDSETTIVEKLGELNRALTEAQIDRVRKESYYNEIKLATPEYIPDALTNPLIQRLREDYNKLNREYLKKEETFKPDYPEMQRLKTELDSAKEALQNETQNIIRGGYSDFQAALKREQSLGAVFNGQKREAILMNSNAILYNSLKIELENKKSLLDSLLKRQNETGVSARLKGLRTSNVWIVDRASMPIKPSSPKKALNIILALIFGLMGGLGLVFLFEYLDNSVKSLEDVEKYSGFPTLGVIPEFNPEKFKRSHRAGHGGTAPLGQDSAIMEEGIGTDSGAQKDETPPDIKTIELIAHIFPKSNYAENYRSIRTTLLLSSPDGNLRSLVVSSPLPQEGKTATISNLAVTLAQANKRVLLVDSDLRKPRLHKIFGIKNTNGLTNYLSSNLDLRDLVKPTKVPNLFLINSGPVPPNPVELLGSEKMSDLTQKLKQGFDYVLYDVPPILSVSDAIVLGTKLDGLVLVAWGGKTSREALRQTKDKLALHKIKCLGVVLNNINVEERGYYHMRHYYDYYGG